MNLIQDVLSAASTQPEQDRFARIKLADILPDPENFYETDGIEELAAAIDAFGLEQPLVVRPADEAGKYRLTGGHRRRLALLTLYAKDPERWAEVDVKITSSLGALADQARLILMNRTARKETEYENMMETVKTAEIAKEFKANGGKVEGKTRAAVAAALGISSAQAGKYQAIYKHLCPTLMQRYKAGVIGTQVAYELSGLPNRQQEEIAATYPVPTLEVARKKKESTPETFPDWALPMAKEFVNQKWVRKLEYFSAASLQALAKDPTGGTNRCGGITDTSAKGIRFYFDGQRVQYTWEQFVKACAGAGITPELMPKKAPAQPQKAPMTREERYATFIHNDCPYTAGGKCDNVEGILSHVKNGVMEMCLGCCQMCRIKSTCPTVCTHCGPQQAPDAETKIPAPPADALPATSEISPAPIPQEEPPAVERAEPTASDDVIDAARDLSNYCEEHGSGECCKGCYFFDEQREGCRIGLPFAWEV
ncbi:ParB/RepB/Spo0J family partition protein [Gemmiger sp.]